MKTKKLIYTLLFFSFGFGFAQEVVIPIEQRKNLNKEANTYYYYKDVNNVLNKYVGTWKYETSTEVFEITFNKRIHQDHGGDYKDELTSKFKYTRNGVVIYNSYITFGKYHILGGSFKNPNNTNKITLLYNEPDVTYRTIRSQLELEFIPGTGLGSSNNLLWKRNVFKDTPDPTPFELPENMVLVKQL